MGRSAVALFCFPAGCVFLCCLFFNPLPANDKITSENTPVEQSVYHVTQDCFWKTYVNKLYTPSGRNILRDSPSDHKHHHALMFGIILNDINFWEEFNTEEYGRQIPQKKTVLSQKNIDFNNSSLLLDYSEEELAWTFPDGSVPAREHRRIIGWQSKTDPITFLDWVSELEITDAYNEILLKGNHYHGLGLRFDASMDKEGTFISDSATLQQRIESGTTEHLRGDEYLTSCRWMAYTAQLNGSPVTVAIFDAPENLRPMTAFTMGQEGKTFAYLSATFNLWHEPLLLKQGEHVRFHYGIALWDGRRSVEEIESAYQTWCKIQQFLHL